VKQFKNGSEHTFISVSSASGQGLIIIILREKQSLHCVYTDFEKVCFIFEGTSGVLKYDFISLVYFGVLRRVD
jgi:hypothetical protein